MRKVQNQMVHGRSTILGPIFVHGRSAVSPSEKVSRRNLFEQKSDYEIIFFIIFYFEYCYRINETRIRNKATRLDLLQY